MPLRMRVLSFGPTAKRHGLTIIFMIVALLYVMLMGAFFAYERRQGEDKLVHQHAVAECLGSGGHVGPGLSCWYENSTDKKQWPLQ
jgi:hypothetical protein